MFGAAMLREASAESRRVIKRKGSAVQCGRGVRESHRPLPLTGGELYRSLRAFTWIAICKLGKRFRGSKLLIYYKLGG